jgi:BCCT family betaine/carnitine transporter
MSAKEAKLAASELAQEARVSFDTLMRQKAEDEALQANEDVKSAIKTRLNSPS